jgi:hypothetical protein
VSEQQPQQPGAVPYAPDNAVVRLKVDGREMDTTVADLRKSAQMASAAEKRLQEANALKAQHAGAIEFASQMETLLRTNPDAALAEIQRRASQLHGRPIGVGSTDASYSGEELDPVTKQTRSELMQIQSKIAELTKFRDELTTQSHMDRIKSVVGSLPLYQGNAKAREQAEVVVAAYQMANPSKPLEEVAAELHALQADMLSDFMSSQRDQRASAASQLAGIPPAAGTPGLTANTPPKPSAKDLQSGQWRSGFKSFVNQLRNDVR